MDLLDYHRLRRKEVESGVPEQPASFVAQMDAFLPQAGEKLPGDLVDIQPSPLHDRLRELCRLYLGATPDQQLYMRTRIDRKRAGPLTVYGLREAVLGVRSGSEDLVRLGLTAFAIENLASGDARETLMSVSVLYHAAERVGNAAAIFEETARISGPGFAGLLRDFAARHPNLRKMSVMGWHEVETPDGPGFRWSWPTAPSGRGSDRG